MATLAPHISPQILTHKRTAGAAELELCPQPQKREEIEGSGRLISSVARSIIEEFSREFYLNCQRFSPLSRTITVKSYFPDLMKGGGRVDFSPARAHKIALSVLIGEQRTRVSNPLEAFQWLPKEDSLSVWYRAAIKALVVQDSKLSLEQRITLHRMLGHFTLYLQMRVYERFRSLKLHIYYAETKHQFGVGSREMQAAHHSLLPRIGDSLESSISFVCKELWEQVRQIQPQPSSSQVCDLLLLLLLRGVGVEKIQEKLLEPYSIFHMWVKEGLQDVLCPDSFSLISSSTPLSVLSNATFIATCHVNETDGLIEMRTRPIAMDYLTQVSSHACGVEQAFAAFGARYEEALEILQLNIKFILESTQGIHEALPLIGKEKNEDNLVALVQKLNEEYSAFVQVYSSWFDERHSRHPLKMALERWKLSLEKMRRDIQQAMDPPEASSGVMYELGKKIKNLTEATAYNIEEEISEIKSKISRHQEQKEIRLVKLKILDEALLEEMRKTHLGSVRVRWQGRSGEVFLTLEAVEVQRKAWMEDIRRADKAISLWEKKFEEVSNKRELREGQLKELEELRERAAAMRAYKRHQDLYKVLGSDDMSFEIAHMRLVELCQAYLRYMIPQTQVMVQLDHVMNQGPYSKDRSPIEYERWMANFALSTLTTAFDFELRSEEVKVR